jgi:hypothetical protein
MLLLFQQSLPYHEKTYRQIGYAAAIELLLFFILAVMVRTSAIPAGVTHSPTLS